MSKYDNETNLDGKLYLVIIDRVLLCFFKHLEVRIRMHTYTVVKHSDTADTIHE